MKVYKRSLWSMLFSILLAPCAAVVVYIALNFFINTFWILICASALAFIILLYMAVFSENIRFELDDNGKMRYFKKGILKNTYELEQYLLSYHSKNGGGGTNITLHFHHIDSGKEESIDCSPLGKSCFADFYAEIKAYTKEQPEVLRAQ